MMTEEMTTAEAMTTAVTKANKRTAIWFSQQKQLLAETLPALGHYSISSGIPFAARSSSG